MNTSAYMKRIKHSIILLMPVLILLSPLFLASCSDSEQRIANGENMSRVLINLGTGSNSKSDRMAATAPTNITTITITVTGPGMTPIVQTLSSAPGTIDLSVPSGPARRFTAMVTTTDGIYSGTALASLPAGQTVSVPIVMRFGGSIGFKDEGTIESPVVIPAGIGSSYTGTVGKGKSYYVTNQGSPSFLEISITGLTDDADLIAYGTTPGYTTAITPNFGQNYIGKTMDENWNASEPNVNYYFVVDGSHTKNGARFVLRCFAHSGSIAGPPNVGTMLEPNIVPVGLPYSTRVAWESLLLTNANFYASILNPGTQYWINTYPDDPMNMITIYMGPLFSNPMTPGISTFTASIFGSCYSVTNLSFANSFTLEVVAHEGTPVNPIELYVDESTNYLYRANYCMVGGDGGSSYYRFPVTDPAWGNGYYFYVDYMLGDVDLYVYDDPDFTDELGSSVSSALSMESVGAVDDADADGYIYVRVADGGGNGYGSTFILYTEMNAM